MTWFDRANEQLAQWKAGAAGQSIFTPQACQVLAHAREEADRLYHNYVGTEHLLLSTIKHSQGVAIHLLKKFCPDLEIIRTEIEKAAPSGPVQKTAWNLPYTPRVKKVFTLAQKEAKALNQQYVGTEHLLLGLLVEGDGIAAKVLKNLKMEPAQMRQEIVKILSPIYPPDAPGGDPPSPPSPPTTGRV